MKHCQNKTPPKFMYFLKFLLIAKKYCWDIGLVMEKWVSGTQSMYYLEMGWMDGDKLN